MVAGVRNRLLLAALLVSLTGCARESKRIIAVIPKATAHLFWVATETGARAAARERNVEMVYNGPASETDYARQIQIVDSMIARKVDGIAIAAAERKALVAAIDRAMAAGIPVTVFDSGLDSENYVTFVATNNYEGGQTAARELARLLGGSGKVALLMHAPGSLSSMDRERGFRETLAKEFPAVVIAAEQFGMSDRAKARAAAENFLSAHPDLQGMFASAEPSSIGAALAVRGRNLAGKVRLVTFDSSDNLTADLRDGVIDAMIVQDPFKIGYEAVRTLCDKLDGRTPPKHMDLSAQLIHREDLAKPEIQRLLAPELKK